MKEADPKEGTEHTAAPSRKAWGLVAGGIFVVLGLGAGSKLRDAAEQRRPGPMRRLAGGTFRMGSRDTDPDRRPNEQPAHDVKVASVWMDVTEVTVAAFRACVDAGSCSKPDEGPDCNWGKSDRSNHPINCVDWGQAAAYCRWANKRLPTEEEWEFAAKPEAPKGDLYPWGDRDLKEQACWSGVSALGSTCAVGSHPAGKTSAGLEDMVGNVFEWTASLYCPYTEAGSNTKACAKSYVIRGGSWPVSDAAIMRAAYRMWFHPTQRERDLGFRCARS